MTDPKKDVMPLSRAWLERAQVRRVLLQEVERGLADIAAGRTSDARALLRRLKKAQATGS